MGKRSTGLHRRQIGAGLICAGLTLAAPAVRAQQSEPVQAVRRLSGVSSSLPERDLDIRLQNLLAWVLRSYQQSGSLHLLSDAPEGASAGGGGGARMQTLRQTYWLQDNVLYAAGALLQYAPPVGQTLTASWRAKWDVRFPQFCPDTQSGYAVGILPQYDGVGAPSDSRCRLPRPGPWQYFRMTQYPKPNDPGFDSLPRPIIGADYPAGPDGRSQAVPIAQTSVRDLLKYGCLRQVMLGDHDTAQQMFDLALAQWDGNGFRTSKNSGGGSLAGTYWTRDIAFALMCANALGEGRQPVWSHGVSKAALEQKLWDAQAQSGGIWTTYCAGGACGGPIPASAKLTNEIAPLVLLAYGRNIWVR